MKKCLIPTIKLDSGVKLTALWLDRKRKEAIEKIFIDGFIDGNIELYGREFRDLGNLRSVFGDLIIDCCFDLKRLCDNLYVRGNLIIKDCPNLTELPENLRVDGKVTIKDCHRLTVTRENFKNCTSVEVSMSQRDMPSEYDLLRGRYF
jgi:hypothetical protein